MRHPKYTLTRAGRAPHSIQPLSREKVLRILTSLVLGDNEDASPPTPEDSPTVKPLKWADTPNSVRRRAFASVEECVCALAEEYMRRINAERAARRDARDWGFHEGHHRRDPRRPHPAEWCVTHPSNGASTVDSLLPKDEQGQYNGQSLQEDEAR